MTVLKARIGGQWVPIGGASDYARWNSAWGLLAVGSMVANVNAPLGGSVTKLTSAAVPVTLLTGRRYKVTAVLRAIGPMATGNLATSVNVKILDNGSATTWADHWYNQSAEYGSMNLCVFRDGDGLSHSLELAVVNTQVNAATLYGGNGCGFFVEDVGPVSGAVPVPNPTPAWIPMTALQNGFVNLGAPRPVPRYRKVGDIVEIQVAVKSGTANSGIFWLPVGYRPPGILDFAGRDGAGAAIFNVASDGGIVWYGLQANNTLVALNCSFSTTA